MYRQEFYIITRYTDKGSVAFRKMTPATRKNYESDWTDNIFAAWHFPTVKIAKQTFQEFFNVNLQQCKENEVFDIFDIDYTIKKVILDPDQSCIIDSFYMERSLKTF